MIYFNNADNDPTCLLHKRAEFLPEIISSIHTGQSLQAEPGAVREAHAPAPA